MGNKKRLQGFEAKKKKKPLPDLGQKSQKIC